MASLIHEQAVKECEQRLAATPESATVRGLIFNAVLGLLARHHGNAAAEALRASVSKKNYVDFFSYPAKDFLRILYGAAERLAPEHGGSLEEALRACGGAAVGGFFQSGVGRTLTQMVGQGDPKRLFSSAPTAYSTTVGYGKRTYTQLTERSVRLHFKDDMQPVQFHQGLLEVALKSFGGDGKVEVRVISLTEAEYTLSWQ